MSRDRVERLLIEHREECIRLVKPVAQLVDTLPPEIRSVFLLCCIAQEICRLPPQRRAPEVRALRTELPHIFRITETAMRECLIDNARDAEGAG